MRAKHSRVATAALMGLGLLATGCGPIAFTDTVNFQLAAPAEPAPEPEPVSHAHVEGDHIIIDDKIQFGHDSATISRESLGLINDVAKLMQDNPQIEHLQIIGHTSSEGGKKHNIELSKSRAQAVMEHLVQQGVAAERMSSDGKGPTEPIADNDTEEGRQANRRVEFKIDKMAEGAGAEDSEAKGGARGRPGA